MRGATAPRLLLEMMCARILLPGIDGTVDGLGARLDRIERRLSVVGDSRPVGTDADGPRQPAGPAAAVAPAAAAPGQVAASEVPTEDEVRQAAAQPAEASPMSAAPTSPVPASATQGSTPAAGQLGLVDVRQLWPGVLDRVKQMRRYAWILLSQNAHVKDVGGGVITIGLLNAGARDSFTRSGADEILHQALIDELGVDWRVDAIIDGASDVRSAATAQEPPLTEPPPADGEADARAAVTGAGVQAAKGAIRPTRPKRVDPEPKHAQQTAHAAEVDDDDDVIDEPSLESHELLSRELGARVIEDIRHDSV
jgi:DNA polymerase-3 subunit gamma/tau